MTALPLLALALGCGDLDLTVPTDEGESVELSEIRVTPTFVEILVADTVSFTAVALAPGSREVPAEFLWTADGGNVDPQTGTFVAGPVAGEFEVRAEPVRANGRRVAAGHAKGRARVRIKNRPHASENRPPEVSFSHACNGLACSFDASDSVDPDGRVVAVEWEFGDGASAEGPVVAHEYDSSGSFLVTVRVVDDDSATGTIERPIAVEESPGGGENAPPTAAIDHSCENLACAFDGRASSDADGTIVSFEWDLGDGTTESGPEIAHEFADAGTFAVTLVVRDEDGATASRTVSVTATRANQGPVASFEYSCVDLACDFDATQSTDPDGVVVGYAWDFGDGFVSTSPIAHHDYSASGDYIISLEVRDEAGAADEASREIAVTAPSNPPSDDPLNTTIYPGEEIQAAVDANPPGTEFFIKAGTHRLQVVRPKTGNIFTGEAGAVLSGARVLTEFQREGGLWVATGQTQENPRYGPNPYGSEVCFDDSPACIYPEDLFFDDAPLRQVLSRAEVGPGTWYFDYAGDQIYFADDPTGRLVETSVAPYAFRADNRDDLVIRNLVIEKYANAAQVGAIYTTNSDRVRIERNTIRLNHGAGINLCCGRDGRIVGNEVYLQGQIGLGSWGATNLLVEANEIHHNNHARYWSSWEGGGAKIAVSTDALIRDNHAYSNEGKGLWTDGDNIDAIVERNEVHDNTEHGLFHEISYRATFRNNVVYRNGWHGIVIDSSPDVEVTGNRVWDNGWAKNHTLAQIFGRDTHGGASGRYGAWVVTNILVHDNTVEGQPLAGLDGPERVFSESAGNRFEDNHYTASSDRPFWSNGTRLTIDDWKARGFDRTSEFK